MNSEPTILHSPCVELTRGAGARARAPLRRSRADPELALPEDVRRMQCSLWYQACNRVQSALIAPMCLEMISVTCFCRTVLFVSGLSDSTQRILRGRNLIFQRVAANPQNHKPGDPKW